MALLLRAYPSSPSCAKRGRSVYEMGGHMQQPAQKRCRENWDRWGGEHLMEIDWENGRDVGKRVGKCSWNHGGSVTDGQFVSTVSTWVVRR